MEKNPFAVVSALNFGAAAFTNNLFLRSGCVIFAVLFLCAFIDAAIKETKESKKGPA